MSDEGYDNGELISEPLVNQAVVGVTYEAPDGAGGTWSVTADGLVVTATITGGNGDEVRYIDWGDGTPEEQYVLSDEGDQTCHHTYGAAGTYTVTGMDSAKNPLGSDTVTVAEPEFDPGDHTVAEVEAYVAANPDERDAVLAAERAGKNRTTLIAALEGDSG